MVEDNTPTVNARTRKPNGHLRLRFEKVRRAQGLNKATKAKRVAKRGETKALDPEEMVAPAPRVPKVKKNVLSGPPKATSKFKKRQVHKAWLPTHLFHAKRAHMPRPTQPLWRMAIPLTPTEKDYRSTHRATGARGAVAWDMSYISTISLTGVEKSLEGLLKSIGFGSEEAWSKKGSKWRAGTRTWEAWVYERDNLKSPIAPIVVLWCPELMQDVPLRDSECPEKASKRNMFIRVHPSAFLQLWNELLKASKTQKPSVTLEDIRFEVGSIDVVGPGSTEALMSALRPIVSPEATVDDSGNVWTSLRSLTNPASLPKNVVLSFCVSDPRHGQHQKPLQATSEHDTGALAQLIVRWPPDQHRSPSQIFSRLARMEATRLLASQKAINRRKALEASGDKPLKQGEGPSIPVMLLSSSSNAKGNHSQGMWTVVLPWKCVPHVWNTLLFCPLSSGGVPRFGGLVEKQQVAFEAHEPWFPGDFPGTLAGWSWEMTEREKRYQEWKRKPPGRRVEWATIHLGKGRKGEIGEGWACDWEFLVHGPQAEKTDRKDAKKKPAEVDLANGHTPQLSGQAAVVSAPTSYPPFSIQQVPSSMSSSIFALGGPSSAEVVRILSKPSLVTVRIKIIHRGSPKACARVYRLPTNDAELRKQWLMSATSSKSGRQEKIPDQLKPSNPHVGFEKDVRSEDPTPESRAKLIASLLSPENKAQDHLPLPLEEDLIGFVTSGGFCLSEGKGAAIGSISLQKVLQGWKNVGSKSLERDSRLCVLRDAGTEVGWLGIWEPM